MKTGHGFTVQGRITGLGRIGYEGERHGDVIEQLLDALEDGGAVEPVVSVNEEYAGITAYFYAENAEAAMDKLRNLGVTEGVEVLP